MSERVHDLDSLLQAYVDALTLRHLPRGPFGPWAEHVLTAYCRCFGVSFEECDAPSEGRDVLVWLKRVLGQEAALPYPTKGALEAGLVFQQCPAEFEALFALVHDLTGFYRTIARHLAAQAWGDIGTRSDSQLVAAGLDRSLEPNVGDH